MVPLIPFACFSSLMGCGVSKFDTAEEGSPHKVRPVGHPRNVGVDYCLIPKPSPECGGKGGGGGGGGEHAKWDNDQQQNENKKVNDGENIGIHRENVQKEDPACDKEDCKEDRHERDDSIACPGSPSFRDYCVLSQSDDDNSEGDSNTGKIKDKQQQYVHNCKKGSRTLLMKGGSKIGKGLRTGSAKVKNILRA